MVRRGGTQHCRTEYIKRNEYRLRLNAFLDSELEQLYIPLRPGKQRRRMLAICKNNSRRHKAAACHGQRAIKDLRNAGLIETEQRYKENGANSTLIYKIN